MLKQVPSWSCDYHFLILLLKFILGNSYSSYKSSAKAYIGNISMINPQSLYTSQSRVRFGRKLCFPYFLSQEKAMSSNGLFAGQCWLIYWEYFLDEPWMLTWRGSLINPKYLFAGVSSLVNAFSTGWRIFCSMFVSYYSHYRVYHNYCQLRLIILIYCHLSSLICVTVPGGQVSDWHEYFRVRKRAVSWGLF